MKPLIGSPFDDWRETSARVVEWFGNTGDETCGLFRVPFRSRLLTVIASSGLDWDHVSVSLQNRCPNWDEMSFVKRAFFRDEEWAMELHAAVADHISYHSYTLHLWRPQKAAIPIPPSVMVA